MRFTILGCGSSPGVPRIGGHWGACDPENPKNRRRRCSLLAQRVSDAGVTSVIVDTSPDLREQALAAGLESIDGVLYTHPHADHLHGIDDLRGFVINMRRRVDIYADDQTMARLRQGFGYCFETPTGSEYPPILNGHAIMEAVEVVDQRRRRPDRRHAHPPDARQHHVAGVPFWRAGIFARRQQPRRQCR